jgi:hypothetical protein
MPVRLSRSRLPKLNPGLEINLAQVALRVASWGIIAVYAWAAGHFDEYIL